MKYNIRELQSQEYFLLEDFLYEAIFQRDEKNLIPKSIIYTSELQVYISKFGKKKDDYCLCAEVDGKVVGAVWVRNIQGYGVLMKSHQNLLYHYIEIFVAMVLVQK